MLAISIILVKDRSTAEAGLEVCSRVHTSRWVVYMEVETYQAGAFILSAHHSPMLNSLQLQSLAHTLPGIKVPEMVYGSAHVQITHLEAGFAFDFNALDALRYCGYEARQSNLHREGELRAEHIAYIPECVQVSMADQWKGRKLPKDSIFREEGKGDMAAIEVASIYQSDWTYCTPYRGLIRGLADAAGFSPLPAHVRLTVTEESIPLEHLGPDNPVLWGAAVSFFEDELDDSGQSKCYIRVRAMADCWYALLRSYVRVDNVLIRILDTRIYHEYGKSEVQREFRVQESTFEELRTAGFVRTPQWANDQRQDDLVCKYLVTRSTYKDKVSYS